MYTSAFLTTLLAGLAAAHPMVLNERQASEHFSVIATHSGSAVHLSSINANGGKFWIGKDTQSYCDSTVVDDCPAGNVTAFQQGSGTLGLDTEVPGGQQVYISSEDGSLSFTSAHSGYIPTGSLTKGFAYEPASSNNSVGSLTFGVNGEGFYACPAENTTGVYQIFVASGGNASSTACIGIALATTSFDGIAAWQYS